MCKMAAVAAASLAAACVVASEAPCKYEQSCPASIKARPDKLQLIQEMTEWQRKTPLEWLTYVNKQVKVLAAEKHKYEGWVLTVDPVSANILLANPLENGKVSISAVLGHAVQDVEIVTEADDEMKEKLVHLFRPGESQTYSQEELEKKKNSLKNWLEKNHIPVKEQGEYQTTLCVAGVLTIDPPYGPEDCNSTNEIILSRIQGLIQGYLAVQQ